MAPRTLDLASSLFWMRQYFWVTHTSLGHHIAQIGPAVDSYVRRYVALVSSEGQLRSTSPLRVPPDKIGLPRL